MRLFRSKDVDGSGTLDMQEFVELVRGSTWYSYGAIVVLVRSDSSTFVELVRGSK